MSITFTSYSGGEVLIGTMAGTQKYDGLATTDSLPIMFGTMQAPLSIGQPLLSAEMSGVVLYDGLATSYAEPMMFGAGPIALGYAGVFEVPTVIIMISGPAIAQMTADGLLGTPGTMSGAMTAPYMVGTTDAEPDMFGIAPQATVFGYVPLPATNPIMLMQFPGFLEVFGQHLYEDLFDNGAASDGMDTQVILNIMEAATATMGISIGMTGFVDIHETVAVKDAMQAVVYLSIAAGAVASDSLGASLSLLLSASDLAQASDSLLSVLDANVLVATIATATDHLQPFYIEKLAETITATDSLQSKATLLASLMSTVQATTTISTGMSMTLLLDNSVVAEDTLHSMLTGFVNILEVGIAYGHIRLVGEDYNFYAMTLDRAAISEYTNMQANSMAPIAGQAYGAFDDGIYLLEGADDAGTQIDARVRTGLDTLGTTLRKEAPYVYIGYTSAGRVCLKVITTDNGTKKENWYALNPIPYESTTENRFRVSKGLHSVYWGFELASLDGSDLTLDFVKVWRLALTRRKT